MALILGDRSVATLRKLLPNKTVVFADESGIITIPFISLSDDVMHHFGLTYSQCFLQETSERQKIERSAGMQSN